MAILGLTHSAEGAALQRLPVAIKVSIGRGPDPAKGQKHPQRLDHFEFLQKVNRGQDVVWDPDPEVTKAMQEIYGKDPREIGIVLLDDDPENVFRTSYAMWTNTECKCRGELVQINGQFSMQAIRKTEKHPEGEPWPGGYKYSQGDKKGQPAEPCGDGCPDLEEGRCKVQGDLHFILEKVPDVRRRMPAAHHILPLDPEHFECAAANPLDHWWSARRYSRHADGRARKDRLRWRRRKEAQFDRLHPWNQPGSRNCPEAPREDDGIREDVSGHEKTPGWPSCRGH